VEPGTPLQFDPPRQQLLLTLRPRGATVRPARPVLIDADDLSLRPLEQTARLSLWLPPG
jgi:hypothetical protein